MESAQEGTNIRTATIYPAAISTETLGAIRDRATAEAMQKIYDQYGVSPGRIPRPTVSSMWRHFICQMAWNTTRWRTTTAEVGVRRWLYFIPDTCSLSPHAVLQELGQPYELVCANNRTKRTSADEDILTINPKGYGAALGRGTGEVLTEGPAIVQYLADLKPEVRLVPAAGAHLFAVLGWMTGFSIDLDRWPATAFYMERIGARASTQAALGRAAKIAPVE